MALWFAAALMPDGWRDGVRLTLRAGAIATVETGVAPEPIDERHGVAIPGLSNLHSHAFQRAIAGLGERRGPTADSFWTWREAMYRSLDRMTPEDMQAIAELAFAEMLEAGFTRVGEFHYVHNDRDGGPYANPGELTDRICAAAEATGIGLTLLPVFYAHANFGGLPPTHGQRRFVSSVDGFAKLVAHARRTAAALPGANVGIAPHSLRAVTPEELHEILPLAEGGPVHIHAAEQVIEVEDCLAWSGRRPVEWLLDHAPLDGRWGLIHATHMTGDETAELARTGAVAGLCPITEANLGDGVFPAEAFRAAGGVFGVGSDSNIRIDAAGELMALEYAQRLTKRVRNVLADGPGASTGRSLFDAALLGGAQALGQPEPGFRAGAPADIVTLGVDHADLAPAERGDILLDRWIFAGREIRVDSVWRNGVRVVEGGRHRARGKLRAGYRAALKRLLA